ncbi:hypothetical protein BDN70DRAFT_940193 [Pholiota conissans]|uniref:Uncharacterized protein n=1 Tax=Pholiota conissans TaxID=109636 RepID=A0A9P6CQA1_9AGAR|nr:hypothetical protein BDN70DRAFT_940193 [Pholiota conissans]
MSTLEQSLGATRLADFFSPLSEGSTLDALPIIHSHSRCRYASNLSIDDPYAYAPFYWAVR